MSVARASRRPASRLAALAALAALALAACTTPPADDPEPTDRTPSPTTSETTATPTSDAPTPPALESLVVAPGRVGPALAGMSREDALATGMFDADVEVGGEECGRVEPLGWKPEYASSLDALTKDDGMIVSIGISGEQPRTADGLGVGSTLREISAVYENAELVEAGYAQTGVFVTQDERWLGFLFDIDPESIKPRSKVLLMEVTQGTRPGLMRDGC